MPFSDKPALKKRILLCAPILFVAFLVSCSMILQPTTPFDRRLVAKRYGTILSQSNPECQDCTDRFLVEKDCGDVITLVVKYDGRVKVIE